MFDFEVLPVPQKVQTIQSWLAETDVSMVDARLPDHVKTWAQDTLRTAVRINLDGPAKHFQSYCKYLSFAHLFYERNKLVTCLCMFCS